MLWLASGILLLGSDLSDLKEATIQKTETKNDCSRRLEHLLNVHPEKYRSRSSRPTRSSTPVDLRSIDHHRSRSVDYL
ncbi:unnamed protein product [Gongylonema pulchrum]|uniref:Secreted protein n=1 Tax=Gongylonema pulchrum TaxID=637853 RepID=A0A183EQ46_9BILA|nr:unnamed protein product [Gongylonema pulchrum]